MSDQMVDSLRHQESEALSKLNDNKAEQQARNLGYLLEEATKNIVETQKKFTALRKVSTCHMSSFLQLVSLVACHVTLLAGWFRKGTSCLLRLKPKRSTE